MERAADAMDGEVVDELTVGADGLRAHARRRGREVVAIDVGQEPPHGRGKPTFTRTTQDFRFRNIPPVETEKDTLTKDEEEKP